MLPKKNSIESKITETLINSEASHEDFLLMKKKTSRIKGNH